MQNSSWRASVVVLEQTGTEALNHVEVPTWKKYHKQTFLDPRCWFLWKTWDDLAKFHMLGVYLLLTILKQLKFLYSSSSYGLINGNETACPYMWERTKTSWNLLRFPTLYWGCNKTTYDWYFVNCVWAKQVLYNRGRIWKPWSMSGRSQGHMAINFWNLSVVISKSSGKFPRVCLNYWDSGHILLKHLWWMDTSIVIYPYKRILSHYEKGRITDTCHRVHEAWKHKR